MHSQPHVNNAPRCVPGRRAIRSSGSCLHTRLHLRKVHVTGGTKARSTFNPQRTNYVPDQMPSECALIPCNGWPSISMALQSGRCKYPPNSLHGKVGAPQLAPVRAAIICVSQHAVCAGNAWLRQQCAVCRICAWMHVHVLDKRVRTRASPHDRVVHQVTHPTHSRTPTHKRTLTLVQIIPFSRNRNSSSKSSRSMYPVRALRHPHGK